MKLVKLVRRALLGVAIALGLALGGTQANAVPTLGLALLIDGSGSISAGEFALQRDAYVAALGSIVPVDGSVAIVVIQFGGDATGVQVEQPLLTVASAANLATVTGNVGAMTQLGGGTPTGPAIQAAAAALAGLVGTAKTVIDVSTDGADNQGVSAASAATTAVAGGIDQVNCLGVGAGAVCNFETGAGSFEVFVADFAGFETAVRGKLVREIIPEPATLLLFGFGLVALGFVARRRRTVVAA